MRDRGGGPSAGQRSKGASGGGILPHVSPRRRDSWWPFISLIPLGLGAWAPIYAGVQARRPVWTALGVAWTVVAILGYVLSALHTGRHADRAAGDLLLAAWFGGALTSFLLRRPYARRLSAADGT